MTDPKNTEDQELSLDQLKDAAGGSKYINDAGTQGSLKQNESLFEEDCSRVAGSFGKGIQKESFDTGSFK